MNGPKSSGYAGIASSLKVLSDQEQGNYAAGLG